MMKRVRQTTLEDAAPDPKKCRVAFATYQKWRREFDSELKTVTWLICDSEFEGTKKLVIKLKCSVCTKFQHQITGRNVSDRWITGADSLRTSNIRDHAKSYQHGRAMSLLRKEHAVSQGQSISSHAPIAAVLKAIPPDDKVMLQRKFDIAYFVTKEKMAFRKYPRLCELEARHGINLGTSYLTEPAGRTFLHFIAEAKRLEIVQILQKAIFFSLLLDGSTDTANIENELLLAVWFDPDGVDEKVYTRTSYFNISRPSSATAAGLFEVVQDALQCVGIQAINANESAKLVGMGTDGASANIANRDLKGLVEKELDHIFLMWCLAHRIELAIKDALKSTCFKLIDEMLLRLYYLYEKSSKKLRQLEEIIADLSGYLTFEGGGTKPIRASGTRWVGHKLSAMKRVLSK